MDYLLWDRIVRTGKFLICLVIAAVSLWRMNQFDHPHSLIAAVMGCVFAIVLTITGFALAVDPEKE